MSQRPVLPCVFVVDLHLYPHCLLFPEVGQLLSSSSPSELDVTIRHVSLGTVHESLKTSLVLWVIKVLVGTSWVQPGAAEVAEVGFALRACHVVA